MSEATQTDGGENAPDGRIFGVRKPRDAGSVSFDLIPEDASEDQKRILMVALLNRDMPIGYLQGQVQKQYYEDNPEDCPAESTVYNLVREHGLDDGRMDGRLKEAKEKFSEARERAQTVREARKKDRDAAQDAEESTPTDDSGEEPSESDRVSVKRGNAAYSGPSTGIDATMQNITERPHQPGKDDGAESEPTTDDETRHVPVEQFIGKNGHSQTRRFEPDDGGEPPEDTSAPGPTHTVYQLYEDDAGEEPKQVELFDDELLPTIRALVKGDAPDSVIRAVAKEID